MASREVKDEELAAHPDLKPIVIAQDGIIVIVNQANPVNELTLVQIKGIFTGEITNWQDARRKKMPLLRLSTGKKVPVLGLHLMRLFSTVSLLPIKRLFRTLPVR